MNAQIQEIGTNNEAEYAALHYAVKELDHMNVHHLPVTFIGDSKVVINQMDDVWPCYETQLTSWIDRIEGALEKLGIDPNYEAVSRKQNKIADQLATQALQGIDISSTIEIT